MTKRKKHIKTTNSDHIIKYDYSVEEDCEEYGILIGSEYNRNFIDSLRNYLGLQNLYPES